MAVMRETIGGYRILNEIGSGGFGTVYRAYSPSRGRVVALKALDPKRVDSNAIERFRREALLTSEINHPNVIRILDDGEDGDIRFSVMEMMPLSLRDALSGGSMPISRVVNVCRQASLGLKAAHDHNVIHRDIKPENILINSNWTVKVSDFGIAHADDLPDLTATGATIGTGRYMSPEQFMDSKRVDARADIYSLGVTLHEMLTGKRYERGESAKASRPTIPGELERIINKCIEMDRERRYESADDLFKDVANVELINRCALIDLYEATNGGNWGNSNNWLTDKPLDDWHGVTANRDGVVSGLSFTLNNLKGEIPPEIAHLTELKTLNLFMNGLSGSIPAELGRLTRLKDLQISISHISGEIPPELVRLTRLKDLDLSINRLSGEIPPELGRLTRLKDLDLSSNRLSGSMPPELCRLTKLERLRLGGNNWTGCIPRALFDIPSNDLDEIDLPVCDD